MNLCVYILAIDTGFAPNPFHGYCTLACCKPDIRRCKEKGDWVIGLSLKKGRCGLIYAMQIEEKLTFKEYWNDVRFQIKKVDEKYLDKSRVEEEYLIGRSGDNIYEPLSNGNWKQHPSRHTCLEFSDNECEKNKIKDVIEGKYVLVSKNFVYYGRESFPLEPEFEKKKLEFLKEIGRYKCTFSPEQINEWEYFIEDLLSKQHGRIGLPNDWEDRAGKKCIKHKIC